MMEIGPAELTASRTPAISVERRGIIEVRTAPGEGAAFRVLLPRAGGESARRVPMAVLAVTVKYGPDW